VLTDGKDECTGQILNELSRISPIEFLKKWTVFEKYIFKVGSFLAQLGIFTTFGAFHFNWINIRKKSALSAHNHDMVCQDVTKISFILAIFVLCEYKQWLSCTSYNWTTIWTIMLRDYVQVKVTNGVQTYTCNYLFVYIILFNGWIMSALYLIHVYYGKSYAFFVISFLCNTSFYLLSVGPFVTLCDTSGFYACILPAIIEWLHSAL